MTKNIMKEYMMSEFNIEKYLLSCEIELTNKDNFTVVMETLERIGMISLQSKTLFQSCHILHKKNKLYIVHFKEMYALDGKECTLTLKDVSIRNLIASLLERWGLIKIKSIKNEPIADALDIHIIPHKERKNWNIKPKYTFKSIRNKDIVVE